MPSDVLAQTCFVTTRNEDPKAGFQRVLDKGRAEQIADYIDNGFGTIPNSIVLSAQPDAHLSVLQGKTIEFVKSPKAFLVLDGQHRVYGFSLAKTALRVPVVIYNGLSRKDETRLFIDINTKQRPVPNELLLDIKRLADYESDQEKLLGAVYDLFAKKTTSPLMGLMSPATRTSGKVSRVTFNAAVKPLMPVFSDFDANQIYEALRDYIRAFLTGAKVRKIDLDITNPTIFKGILLLFPDVARRVKERYGAQYSEANFTDVMAPMFASMKAVHLKNPGGSHKALRDVLLKALESGFKL
jgi:DGQHR domain-containing protein